MVMESEGSTSQGGPQRLNRFARTRLDRVVTLCDKVKTCPSPRHAVTARWSMADPAAAGSDEDTYPEFVRARRRRSRPASPC